MGEVMSNDVQSHEDAAERVAGEDRRASARHAARSLGSVTARIIGGSQVDLVNFSNRGVLFECDSRLLIGARASVRITTTDANLIVTGRVVRSRVKGLVNGALRYDAALILDTELGLVPTLPLVSRDSAELDDLVSFEAELEATSDPSPVEAYLAESEASLLEVAPGAELPMHTPPAPDANGDDVRDVALEPPPMPLLAAPEAEAAAFEAVTPEAAAPDAAAPEAATLEVVRFESAGLADAPTEASTFDDDSEIAFEPAVEFAFDEGGEPSFDEMGPEDGAVSPVLSIEVAAPPVEEPAGESMFDATYMPPAIDEVVAPDAQFDVTPPRPVFDATPSSFFDSRRSESYGDAPAEPVVAFEAEESVVFDEVFEAAPAEEPASADATPHAVLDDLDEPPAVVPDTEDRVLLQFAATVPHDLAELRRIAADNQW
jgi:hypothetical protein